MNSLILSTAPAKLSPRKQPRQRRAQATLEAVLEATIQVLLADGSQALTTTRVAERAGVSVGTMYQYFPHKQALIYALNARYLDVLAGKVEETCRANHGASTGRMVEALVATYWKAKTERADVTRALYRSVVELDNETLIEAFARRVDAATMAMLETADGVAFADLPTVNLTLLATIFGTIRNVFERNLPVETAEAVHRQLVLMCQVYLHAAQSSVSLQNS